MSKRLTLDEACSAIVDCEHKTAPIDEQGDCFAVGTPAMRGNVIDYSQARRINAKTFEEWTRRLAPMPGDLLFAREAPVGPVVLIPDGIRIAPGQRTVLLRTDPTLIDSRYLYYLLASPLQQSRLLTLAEGSTVPHLNVAEVRSFRLPELPPVSEQRAIAATLGALDDKIESLQKSVRLSQDLAQATFKAWFVSWEHWGGARPSDWKAVKLKDICELRRDGVKAGQFPDLPYVPVDALQMKNLAIHNWKPNSEAQSSLVRFEEDDILIGAMRVYFHRVAIAPFAGLTRTTAFTLRPKRKCYLPFSLLLCNEETTIEFAQTTSKGSTMPYAVWEGGLATMDVRLPTEEVLEDFARSVAPLVDFVKESGKQLQALSDLRDFLLPQLLSGRIRVGEDAA